MTEMPVVTHEILKHADRLEDGRYDNQNEKENKKEAKSEINRLNVR
jgi:hypothetical protein